MIFSETFSDKTSSTLPIIINFSTNVRAKRIRKIRDFIAHHPRCKHYIDKGPNFVADGNKEFRLYYVDSSLFNDDGNLKKLNVEKEEILFKLSSEDSLDSSPFLAKKKEKFDPNLCPHYSSLKQAQLQLDKCDKGTMYNKKSFHSYDDLKDSELTQQFPKIMPKVSKSFQVGPDLRFNVIYLNTVQEGFYPLIQKNTFNAITQTALEDTIRVGNKISRNDLDYVYQCPRNSSVKIGIRKSPSFVCNNNVNTVKPKKKKMLNFKRFRSKMVKKRGICRYTDESEVIRNKVGGSKTTSVKFSIKRSPSFVANYIFEILKKAQSNINNNGRSEIIEKSVVDHIEMNNYNVNNKKIYQVEIRNDNVTHSEILKKPWGVNHKLRYRNCLPYTNDSTGRNRPRVIDEENKRFVKNKYPSLEYSRDCHKTDKLDRYKTLLRNSSSYKVDCLFKCTNMDFVFKRSRYAILKKFHRNLKNNKRNHHFQQQYFRTDEEELRKKNVPPPWENSILKKPEKHKDRQKTDLISKNVYGMSHKHRNPTGDSKTTISGFLHSYRPWDWHDYSKLSACVDKEFLEENSIIEESNYLIYSPY